MGTRLLLLLLVMDYGKAAHVILKEPGRYRYGYEEWKPVRDTGLHHRPVRYPVYRKTANSFSGPVVPPSYRPQIKGPQQQQQHQHQHQQQQLTTQRSEKVEIFSPAPPTILGSFSVFGHATVNAREHASHMKKPQRQHYSGDFLAQESHPKATYNIRHHYQDYNQYPYNEQKIQQQQYNDYDQSYYQEPLRPSLPDSSKGYVQPSPSSYYAYDQNYQSGKYVKPQKQSQNSYNRYASLYSPQVNEYTTTVQPNEYDSTFTYYSNPASNIDSEYYNENPVGSVALSNKRRPASDLKPVTEANTLLDIGRPFQSIHSFSNQETIKGTNKPASSYSSYPSVETKVKFSDVAQPFQISNYNEQPVSSSKPDPIPQTYTEEMYPISVTTIDVPREIETQPAPETYTDYNSQRTSGQESYYSSQNPQSFQESPDYTSQTSSPVKEIHDDFSSQKTPFKPSPYDTSKHKSHKNSYYDDDGNPIFLPTPSTDLSPYLSEPKNEITTENPAIPSEYQDSSYIQQQDQLSDMYTTVPVETTTRSKPHRSRRPTRPSTTAATSTTTEEYNYHRRRKPSHKYRTRGSTEKNPYSRTRSTTTTSTTSAPVLEDEVRSDDDINFDKYYTTILPEVSPSSERGSFDFTEEKYGHPGERFKQEEYYNHQVNHKYEEELPQEPEETFSSTTSTTTTTSAPTTSATTTSTTTEAATTAQTTVASTTETVNRIKSKYGTRPRFSIKDYRDKLNKATTTLPPHETEKTKTRNEGEVKFGGKTRATLRTTTTTETPGSAKPQTEPKYQKYKPRLGPSRYKTSTTPAPEIETTTTERSNTFKPSTNRYKPGTGKYYSRYRTSTIPPKEVDDSPVTTTAKITIRPKGVFSAKKPPFPSKGGKTESQTESEESVEEEDLEKFPESLRMNENEVFSSAIKKMDNATMTSIEKDSEELNDFEGDPTGEESLRIADLTSSSSNDFKQSSYLKKSATIPSRRPIPKITLPTEEPILPLEAFFQTHNR